MRRYKGNIGRFLALASFLSLAGTSDLSAQAVIADHNAVEAFDQIPAAWIDSVANLQLFYIHQSHGSQILQGMKMLYTENNDYYPHKMEALWWPYPGGQEVGWNGDTAFVPIVRAYLDSNSVGCNVVSVSWCAGAYTCGQADINKWMTGWAHLIRDYPAVTFVIQTSRLFDPHTQTAELGRNILQANQYIRDYADDSGYFVMDYGDIEGFNLMTGQIDSLANDSGTTWWAAYYNAGNDCPACVSTAIFPSSTWHLSPFGDSESCAHCYAPEWRGLNCYRKAKAWWWLMAQVAGWNPSGADITPPAAIDDLGLLDDN